MKRILIFGDSYVAAADRGRPGFARITPLFLGWRGQHMGRGGTGFVAQSGERLPYPDRLAELLSRQADVVVIQATGNDALCDLVEVEQAARDFLKPVVRRFPSVLLLGPMWALDGAEHLPALCDRMRGVADDLDVPFVDASAWLSRRWIGPDGAHPTRAGHLIIGWRLMWALRRSCTRRRR